MTQCNVHMLTGGRCELDKDHQGDHQKYYGDTAYTWSDESTLRQIKDWEERGA